jgi:O-antigen ligase
MFAILYLLDYYVTSQTYFSPKRKIFIHAIILFLSLCVLLLQSRIVILFYFFGLVILLLNHWKRKFKWSILITLLFSSFLMLIPAFQGRFQVVANETKKISEPKEVVTSDSVSIENLPCMSSTSLRYNALKASWKLVQENPVFGVGTGDWRDELVKEYISSDMPCNAYEETAPHNQYMRTLLKYGFFGLIIYLTYLLFLYRRHRKQPQYGQLPFLICLILCGLGYDLIDVGSSAPVFAFFSSWLFIEQNK